MKPTSLPARLLAATPQGRRLFGILAEQHAEAVRLRKLLEEGEARWRQRGDCPRKHPDDAKRIEAENALRWAQETEAATLRMELQQARATAASMTEAVRLLSAALLELRGEGGQEQGRD